MQAKSFFYAIFFIETAIEALENYVSQPAAREVPQ